MESALKFKVWSLKFIEALNEAKMFIDNIYVPQIRLKIDDKIYTCTLYDTKW